MAFADQSSRLLSVELVRERIRIAEDGSMTRAPREGRAGRPPSDRPFDSTVDKGIRFTTKHGSTTSTPARVAYIWHTGRVPSTTVRQLVKGPDFRIENLSAE